MMKCEWGVQFEEGPFSPTLCTQSTVYMDKCRIFRPDILNQRQRSSEHMSCVLNCGVCCVVIFVALFEYLDLASPTEQCYFGSGTLPEVQWYTGNSTLETKEESVTWLRLKLLWWKIPKTVLSPYLFHAIPINVYFFCLVLFGLCAQLHEWMGLFQSAIGALCLWCESKTDQPLAFW